MYQLRRTGYHHPLGQSAPSPRKLYSCSPGNASIGGHDEDRGHVTLQGPVEEGETLNIQHVDLVDEQHLEPVGHRSRSGWRLWTQARPAHLSPVTHPRDDLRLALLSPLSHLGIDLFSDF